jgi:hypothetical protein
MTEKFLKPFIDRPGILDPTPGNPQGYVTNDGMWAAIPIIQSKKFAIIHNGSHIKVCPNYQSAVNFILRESKLRKKKTNVRNNKGRKA